MNLNFIVDGQLKLSNNYPQFKNDNGIYKYIDLSNHKKKKIKKKKLIKVKKMI